MGNERLAVKGCNNMPRYEEVMQSFYSSYVAELPTKHDEPSKKKFPGFKVKDISEEYVTKVKVRIRQDLRDNDARLCASCSTEVHS